jgi:Flp pilus assembly protein TadD
MRAIRPTSLRKTRQALKEQCEQSEKDVRDKFLAWLAASPTFLELTLKARDELRIEEPSLFVIQHDDLEVRRLPWHEWSLFRDRPKVEPSYGDLMKNQIRIADSPRRDRARILVILGNCEDINTDPDRQFFQEIQATSGADIVFLEAPKREEVNEQLWEQGWDIIFFAGHSTSQSEEARIYLNAHGDHLTMTDLWHGLRRALDNGLKLAIFNSCDGLGLAQGLDDRQIPFTIVMREAIADQVAQQFLRHFLDAFIRKELSLPEAVREAREKIHVFRNQIPCPSWLPVVVQQPYMGLLYWADLVQSAEPVRIEADAPPIAHPDLVTPPTATQAAPLARSPWHRLTQRRAATISALCLALPVISYTGSDFLTDQGREAYQMVTSDRGWAMKKAKLFFSLAVRLNPWNGEAFMFRGSLYEDAGDIETARTYYTRSKDLEHGGGCSNLGLLQTMADRDYATAHITLSHCDYLIPNDNRIYKAANLKNWGQLFYEEQNYPAAEAALKESLQFQPDNGKSSCLLAKTLEQLDRHSEAKAYWQDCLQNASDYYPEVQQWHREAEQELSSRPPTKTRDLMAIEPVAL